MHRLAPPTLALSLLLGCDGGSSPELLEPTETSSRSESAVCAIWTAARVETSAHPVWTAGGSCAVGTLDDAARADTLVRINGYRELVGLGPVSEDASQRAKDQACAELMNANDDIDHDPPSSWTCYSAYDGLGASAGAGSSNLAIGTSDPADAIDLFVGDRGVDSLGHRRWVINFDLGKVGIGFAGNATCLGVFDGSGSSTLDHVAYPPPGPVPLETTQGTWSFHTTGETAHPRVTVFRLSDRHAIAATAKVLPAGYGADTIAWTLGEDTEVGETYRVQLMIGDAPAIVYDVTPVDCTP